MKGDCQNCGFTLYEDDGELALMGCRHRRWKELRTKYTDMLVSTKEECWYPEGSLDVIREREEV